MVIPVIDFVSINKSKVKTVFVSMLQKKQQREKLIIDSSKPNSRLKQICCKENDGNFGLCILTSFSSSSRTGKASDAMKSILCSTPAFLIIGSPISYVSRLISMAVICSNFHCAYKKHTRGSK